MRIKQAEWMKERMGLLGMSLEGLAEKAFLEPGELKPILSGKIPMQSLDEFTLGLLGNALHCSVSALTGRASGQADFLCEMGSPFNIEQSVHMKTGISDILDGFPLAMEAAQKT